MNIVVVLQSLLLYIYIYIYIYIYTHTYTHTHIHTYTGTDVPKTSNKILTFRVLSKFVKWVMECTKKSMYIYI